MDKIALKFLLIACLIIIDAECQRRRHFNDEEVPKPKLGNVAEVETKPFGRTMAKKKRIIDGNKVHDGEFPFMAALLDEDSCFCGGSIVSPSYILTASHCFYDEEGPIIGASDITVTVGSLLWRDGKSHKVANIIEHEKYDNEKTTNDLALLKLETDIELGPNVQTITVSREPILDDVKKYTFTVVGWGYYAIKRRLIYRSSEMLMSVAIDSIPWYKCKEFYPEIHKTNLCMTSSKGRGSCNGDSGGPLITHTPDGVMQVGLVSYGLDCNNTQPEVYTRLSSYYTWIQKHIGGAQTNLNVSEIVH